MGDLSTKILAIGKGHPIRHRYLPMALLILTFCGFYYSILTQKQIDQQASVVQQRIQKAQAWIELFDGVRQDFSGNNLLNPDYFVKVSRAVKLMDKEIGTGKGELGTEGFLNENPRTDQYVKARLVQGRDALKAVSNFEKPILSMMGGVETSVAAVTEPGKASNPQFEQTYREIGDALAAWAGNMKDDRALARLQAGLAKLQEDKKNLKETPAKPSTVELKSAPAAKNDKKTAADKKPSDKKAADKKAADKKIPEKKVAESRPVVVKSVDTLKRFKQTPLWTKSETYSEQLTNFAAARKHAAEALGTSSEDLQQGVATLEGIIQETSDETYLAFSQLFFGVTLILALLLIFFDRNPVVERIGFEDAAAGRRVSMLRDTRDALPYSQIALNQVHELGSKVLDAVKTLHGSLTQTAHTISQRTQQAELPYEDLLAAYARTEKDVATVREQTIQLSLHQNDPQILSETLQRFNTYVDALESDMIVLQSLQRAAFEQRYGMEIAELKRVGYEAQSLVIVLSQWDKKVERLNNVLQELTEALDFALAQETDIPETKPSLQSRFFR